MRKYLEEFSLPIRYAVYMRQGNRSMPNYFKVYLLIRIQKCESISKPDRYCIIINIKDAAEEVKKVQKFSICDNIKKASIKYMHDGIESDLSCRPPVFLAIGMEPYLIAIICTKVVGKDSGNHI